MTRARQILLALVLLLVLAAPAAGGSADPFEALGLVRFDSGIKAPDFTLGGLNGDTVRLSSPNGSASIVVFWATW